MPTQPDSERQRLHAAIIKDFVLTETERKLLDECLLDVTDRASSLPLRDAMQEACDLLAERKYGSPARSPGHNARLVLEKALAGSEPTTTGPREAYEQAAVVVENLLREKAEIWSGSMRVGWCSEKMALATEVAGAIRRLSPPAGPTSGTSR